MSDKKSFQNKNRKKTANYWKNRNKKKKLVAMIKKNQVTEARSRRKIVNTKILKKLKAKLNKLEYNTDSNLHSKIVNVQKN